MIQIEIICAQRQIPWLSSPDLRQSKTQAFSFGNARHYFHEGNCLQTSAYGNTESHGPVNCKAKRLNAFLKVRTHSSLHTTGMQLGSLESTVSIWTPPVLQAKNTFGFWVRLHTSSVAKIVRFSN